MSFQIILKGLALRYVLKYKMELSFILEATVHFNNVLMVNFAENLNLLMESSLFYRLD